MNLLENEERNVFEHLENLKYKLKQVEKKVRDFKTQNPNYSFWDTYHLDQAINDLKSSIHNTENSKPIVDAKNNIFQLQFVDTKTIQDYELANLIRLGLMKAISRPYINTSYIEIPSELNTDGRTTKVDLDLDIESDFEDHCFTQLGEKFLEACSIRNI